MHWDVNHPKEKEMQEAKWLSKKSSKIAEKEKKQKAKRERERYTQLNAQFQRTARREKKAFLSEQYKGKEENNRMGKTRDLVKKIRDTKGTYESATVSKGIASARH